MDIKEEVKEESTFLGFRSLSEREFLMKHFAKKIKIETVTCSSDIKPELVDTTCLQNEEHNLLRLNEAINESEVEIKVDTKDEDWWSERENSCINADIKVETHEGFYFTKPPSLSKEGVSRCRSDIFSDKGSKNDISFNMNKDSHECESDIKCQRQENVVIAISSMEADVCSQTCNAKIISIASTSKQSKLLHQSNTNKQDINKGNCKSILSHDYKNSIKCDISKSHSKYPSHLKNCSLVLDSEESNKCDGRDKGLNQLSIVKTDKFIADAKRKHKICNICNKAFTRSSDLKRHILIHEGIKPHKCNICNKAFTQLSHLKSHKFIHESIKPHQCNICSKTFLTLLRLKLHKLIHEGTKPHKCDICNKGFTRLSLLKTHKMIHEGIKPCKCDICNKAFTQLSNLKAHKLIHEGIKPHKCNLCNKAFTQSSDLKRHKLIHDGMKPHKCNICNKAFTETSSLKKHKMIHEGIKPHKCNICNKAFTESSDLKRHKLIHDGLKPHKCDICNKTFTELSGLKRHKSFHEGIKPHKCGICNKTFTVSSSLKRHKLIHVSTKLESLEKHKFIHDATQI